jgi:hypothetical protein
MHKRIKIYLVLMLLLVSASLFAQPGPPDDPDIPISGIEILLLLGGVLGLRKFYVKSNSKDKS